MIFSGIFFITIFLPISLFLYYISNNRTYRNALLILMSLVFYAWGEPVWILLLLLNSLVIYLLGLGIEKSKKKQSKAFLLTGLVFLLSLLGVFKYTNFILNNIFSLFNISGEANINLGLPLGISFYVFTSIAYLVDVYKRRINAEKNFFNLLLFTSFFFTVTSGPIQRYKDIQGDILQPRESAEKFNKGVHRFIIGLAKKVVIANSAGTLISSFITQDYNKLSVQASWIGILLFAVQIYYDFSGYSDMAIGLASMFGFSLKENFNYPYIAKSAREFWRRWHISLGSFFRDYVYIPLGGSRVKASRWILNIFIVWFLTGLWHGAGWNFIVWGLYFFLLLLIEKLFLQKILDKLPKLISHIYFVLIMLIGWVFFYHSNIGDAFRFLGIMFNIKAASIKDPVVSILFRNNIFFIIASVLCSLPLGRNIKELILKSQNKFLQKHNGLMTNILIPLIDLSLLALSLIFLVGDTYTPFLYFDF